MSSSYSSLDWVLSHWAHFTVPIFICVCLSFLCLSCHAAYVLYYCNTVRRTWWDWSLILRTLSSFSALTLLVGSYPWKADPDMTYNVFGRTLNVTQLQQHCVVQQFDSNQRWSSTHACLAQAQWPRDLEALSRYHIYCVPSVIES